MFEHPPLSRCTCPRPRRRTPISRLAVSKQFPYSDRTSLHSCSLFAGGQSLRRQCPVARPSGSHTKVNGHTISDAIRTLPCRMRACLYAKWAFVTCENASNELNVVGALGQRHAPGALRRVGGVVCLKPGIIGGAVGSEDLSSEAGLAGQDGALHIVSECRCVRILERGQTQEWRAFETPSVAVAAHASRVSESGRMAEVDFESEGQRKAKGRDAKFLLPRTTLRY